MKKLIPAVLTACLISASAASALGQTGKTPSYTQARQMTDYSPAARRDNTRLKNESLEIARQKGLAAADYCNSAEHKQECRELSAIQWVLFGAGTQTEEGFVIPGETEEAQLKYIALELVSLYEKNPAFGATLLDAAPLIINLITLDERIKPVYIELLRRDIEDLSICYDPSPKRKWYQTRVEELLASVNDFHDAQRRCQGKLGSLTTLAQLSRGNPAYEDYARKAIGNIAIESVEKRKGLSNIVLMNAATALIGLDGYNEMEKLLRHAAAEENGSGRGFWQKAGDWLNAAMPHAAGDNIKNVIYWGRPYLDGEVSKAGAYQNAAGGISYEANIWEDLGLMMGEEEGFRRTAREHILENTDVSESGIKIKTVTPFIAGALMSGKVSLSSPKNDGLAKKNFTTPNGLYLGSLYYVEHGMDPVSINELKKRIYRAYEAERKIKNSAAMAGLPPPSLEPDDKAKQAYEFWKYTGYVTSAADVILIIYAAKDIKSLANSMKNLARIIKSSGKAAGMSGELSVAANLRKLPEMYERFRFIKTLNKARALAKDGKSIKDAKKTVQKINNAIDAGRDGGLSNINEAQGLGKAGQTGVVVERGISPKLQKIEPGSISYVPPETVVKPKLGIEEQALADLNNATARESNLANALENARTRKAALEGNPKLTKAERDALKEVNKDIGNLERRLADAEKNKALAQSNVDKINNAAQNPASAAGQTSAAELEEIKSFVMNNRKIPESSSPLFAKMQNMQKNPHYKQQIDELLTNRLEDIDGQIKALDTVKKGQLADLEKSKVIYAKYGQPDGSPYTIQSIEAIDARQRVLLKQQDVIKNTFGLDVPKIKPVDKNSFAGKILDNISSSPEAKMNIEKNLMSRGKRFREIGAGDFWGGNTVTEGITFNSKNNLTRGMELTSEQLENILKTGLRQEKAGARFHTDDEIGIFTFGTDEKALQYLPKYTGELSYENVDRLSVIFEIDPKDLIVLRNYKPGANGTSSGIEQHLITGNVRPENIKQVWIWTKEGKWKTLSDIMKAR